MSDNLSSASANSAPSVVTGDKHPVRRWVIVGALACALLVLAFGEPIVFGPVLAAWLRWPLAAAVLFFQTLVVIGIIRNIEVVNKGNWSRVLALVVIVVLIGSFGCGTLSAFCWEGSHRAYAAHPIYEGNGTPVRFFFAYLVYTFDLIPGLDFCKTLGWEEKLLYPEEWIAGLPVLLYRLLVFAPILAILKKWLDRFG